MLDASDTSFLLARVCQPSLGFQSEIQTFQSNPTAHNGDHLSWTTRKIEPKPRGHAIEGKRKDRSRQSQKR
jgi:hypothetical protein